MDLSSLESELQSLEELHGQGWIVETEYIRRKEELIADIELAKLDAESDDESTEEMKYLNNSEADVSLETQKNEPLIVKTERNSSITNCQDFSSTKESNSVAAKPDLAVTSTIVVSDAKSDEENEEFDPYDMDTKYDPVEEERKKREVRSTITSIV